MMPSKVNINCRKRTAHKQNRKTGLSFVRVRAVQGSPYLSKCLLSSFFYRYERVRSSGRPKRRFKILGRGMEGQLMTHINGNSNEIQEPKLPLSLLKVTVIGPKVGIKAPKRS